MLNYSLQTNDFFSKILEILELLLEVSDTRPSSTEKSRITIPPLTAQDSNNLRRTQKEPRVVLQSPKADKIEPP